MKNLTTAALMIVMTAVTVFSQPLKPYTSISQTEVDTLIRKKTAMGIIHQTILVDGAMDSAWMNITPNAIRMINADTLHYRSPESISDLSASYRMFYDTSVIRIFVSVADDEVNDGKTDSSVFETIQLFEAPYPNSVAAPYPSCIESAPEANMKYAYWNYLGARRMTFNLNNTYRVDSTAGTPLIHYSKINKSTGFAWAPRPDGKGYNAEITLTWNDFFVDSNGVRVGTDTNGINILKSIAFEIQIIDRDKGKKDIRAGWNSGDARVDSAMCFTGILEIWDNAMMRVKQNRMTEISVYPNPADNFITLVHENSTEQRQVEIYSINGTLIRSEQYGNSVYQTIDVSDIPAGMYLLKVKTGTDCSVSKLIIE